MFLEERLLERNVSNLEDDPLKASIGVSVATSTKRSQAMQGNKNASKSNESWGVRKPGISGMLGARTLTPLGLKYVNHLKKTTGKDTIIFTDRGFQEWKSKKG